MRVPLAAASIVVAAVVPFLGIPAGRLQLLIFWGINTLLAQSLNLLTGYAGQISLGHAGLYAAGAYGSAVLAVKYGWPLWSSLPAAVILAAIVGLLVAFPAERVREFYLAMVTLAFGSVAFVVAEQWTSVTGGFMGLSNIPSPILGSLRLLGAPISLTAYYFLVLGAVACCTWLQANLVTSHVGRAFLAVQGSELAAATLGIRPGAVKHLAYVLSAALAGLAGALYAHLVAFINPEAFSIWTSVAILVSAVFGGLRTTIGPFLGAAFFTFVPEQMHVLQDYQLLVYGIVLMGSFMLLPKGLAGLGKGRAAFIRAGAMRRSRTLPAPESAGPPVDLPDGAPLLEVVGVSKDFDGLRALQRVDMVIQAGRIHGLIGPNGSGKSTLINVITGIYHPTEGSLRFAGQAINGLPPYVIAACGISRIFQNPQTFDELTVRENVMTGADRRFTAGLMACAVGSPGATAEEARILRATDAVIEAVGLGPLADTVVGSLPYGRKRLVEIARALIACPTLLILDEPGAGLSESELVQLTHLLRTTRSQRMTILIIEHHMEFLLGLVDSVTVLDHGERIFEGAPAAARRDARVIEAYLGRDVGAQA